MPGPLSTSGGTTGTPYSLDPINGVDVDVQTAQGVNQVGVSVERQSVAGVSRELIIHCHSPHGDADGRPASRSAPLLHQRRNVF